MLCCGCQDCIHNEVSWHLQTSQLLERDPTYCIKDTALCTMVFGVYSVFWLMFAGSENSKEEKSYGQQR
ncbi:unnamed protein product [Camellia sinensis]